MAYYERLSIEVFGRQIPQVLLLHANLLNAEHLERVVDMLAARAYAFIGLPKAVSDPAYAREDTYVGPQRREEPRPRRRRCRSFRAGSRARDPATRR
jgi:hypothetical protein